MLFFKFIFYIDKDIDTVYSIYSQLKKSRQRNKQDKIKIKNSVDK